MMCNVQWTRAAQLLAVLTVLGSVAVDCRSPVNLKVFWNTKPSGEPSDQVINCSIDSKTTAIDKIFKLALLGSSLYGSGDDFDQLAVLDIWSKSPRLVDELQEEDVAVDGSIGSNLSSRPYLAVSRRHQPTAAKLQSFKCVVNGLDKSEGLVNLSATVKPEPVGTKCLEKVEGINEKISALSMKVGGMLNSTEDVLYEVQSLHVTLGQFQAKSSVADEQISSKFADLSEQLNDLNVKSEDKFGKVSTQILDLTNQVADVETKSRQMNEGVSTQLETLAANLKDFQRDMNGQFRMLGIDRSRFEVSDTYRNTVYLVSKTQAVFNIASANNFCRESGGYLVELDDKEEYQFVKDLVTRIGGANSFWTGGNDIDSEGTFVYYNSKKPVPPSLWSGQPDNAGGNEDCMEIRLNFGGRLNDWVCTQSGKYVCELPLY